MCLGIEKCYDCSLYEPYEECPWRRSVIPLQRDVCASEYAAVGTALGLCETFHKALRIGKVFANKVSQGLGAVKYEEGMQ